MKIKKTIRQIHKWAGLVITPLVILICITGSMFVFADEILEYCNREIASVEMQEIVPLPLDELVDTVKKSYPSHILVNVVQYKNKDRAVVFFIANKTSGPSHVFVNPYTGEIIGESTLIKFFSLTAHLHKDLWMGKTGSWIVLIISILFLAELITGIILCWPVNKNFQNFKRLFIIKKTASSLGRTVQYHRAFGMYSLIILLVVTVTGILISLTPKHGIEAQKKTEIHPKFNCTGKALPLSGIIKQGFSHADTNAVKTELWNIKQSPFIECTTAKDIGLLTYTGGVHLINKYTGEEIHNSSMVYLSKVRNILRKLHIGDWMNFIGKTITFFSGLAGVFLAGTGFIIFRKINNKKKRSFGS